MFVVKGIVGFAVGFGKGLVCGSEEKEESSEKLTDEEVTKQLQNDVVVNGMTWFAMN